MSRTRPPRYEGRPLPRPEEEVVDQGLGFDLGTRVSRRSALRGLGAGVAALGLAACGGGTSSTGGSASASPSASASTGAVVVAATAEIPDETAGPYPGDGSNGPDVLGEPGIVRSDIRSSSDGVTGTATAEGVPMRLDLVVRDLANGGTPFAGAAVYVWQCDREGRYSLYSDGVTSEDYLRGVQVADAQGRVSFTSIWPACYPGRWPHVHVEVYPDLASTADSTSAVATSQVALPQDVCETVYAESGYEDSVRTLAQVSLSSDGVFGEDSGALQLGMVTGEVASGYVVTLGVGVDTRTAPAASGGGPRR